MKAKKVLGLALSAMMAISAVVPWTGLTASAEDGADTAANSAVETYKSPDKDGDKGIGDLISKPVTIYFVDKDTKKTVKTVTDSVKLKDWSYFAFAGWVKKNYAKDFTDKKGNSYTYYDFSCDRWDGIPLHYSATIYGTLVKEEPENVEVTVKYVDENQNPIEGYESKTFTVKADELESWKANEEFVIDIPGYTYQKVAIDFGTSLTVKYQKNETPVEPEIWWYNVRFYLNGESKGSQAFTVETSTDTAVVDIASLPAFTDEFEGATYDHDASSADNATKNVDGTFTISGSDTAVIHAYFTKEETPVEPETKYPYVIEQYVDGELVQSVDWSNNTATEVEVLIPEREDATLSQIMFDDVDVTALYGEGDIAKVYFGTEDTGINYIRIYYVSETPVEPETKYPYIIEQYVNGELVQSVDYSNNTLTEVEVEIPEREGATLSEIWFDDVDVTALYDEGDIAKVYFGTEDTGINYIRIFYVTEDAPAQDMTLNMTYADIDSDKVLGHGAAVISSDIDLTAWINEQYTGNIITYDGVQYVYTGVYASTANDTTINATLYYREVEVAEEDREIQLTFVDADDQTKVLGHGAGVVPAGETSEAWIYNVYNGDVIEYAGAKYVYTGSNTIVENEDGITATLLYRKAEVVEKDREIQLTFVDIDSNKTLGHGAGVVPAGEASEAWIYNVYNGDVITFENEKYTYTGANTIVENETSITATLYYKKAEVVGEDKEIQLTFVDADDQTKVLGHGAGVVLAGQTVEEWLNEVYPIGDVIEYAGAKYAYTGANAIVEGEDSFTATLLYRKTEALEKDKEIQLIFVDADNQTKVLGRGAGVVLAGQSIEEWLDEVYPIGDVITYKNEEYVYTGSKSVVEGEDSITATLLYRKDTDPTDPDEPDEPDPDRPSSGGGYYPSRPDEEEIDDPTTPEASDPGTTPGGGSAGPGGAGDGAVAVEDPTDTLGDNDVPRVNAPQTGRKIAGSIALLAGAAAVAVVTLKKRKDK